MKRVIVNGSFDILHVGHIKLLEYAATFGAVLVLIDSDRRIKELKGPSRPVNGLYERITLLRALKSVDEVEAFDSDLELENLIREYTPDIMVKGSDWKGGSIIGACYCNEIKFYDRIEQYSTTKTIQDISTRG
jgi:rfaE bifunctional protein nucleotidyltransferase chain/domain